MAPNRGSLISDRSPTVGGIPEFRLQFPAEQLRAYAARYAYADDGRVIAIGQVAQERGYYTLDEFRAVCRWKTTRSSPLVALNDAATVEQVTRTALADSTPERQRMESLRGLHGVDWSTASVLLHLAEPDRWPILDKRALQAFGISGPATYTFRFWEQYVNACRQLGRETGIDGRTLDQALWQWSKEQGVRLA
jgi:hypothetical protein